MELISYLWGELVEQKNNMATIIQEFNIYTL